MPITTGLSTIIPLEYRTPIGRQNEIRGENDEQTKPCKINRSKTLLKYSKCNNYGHNKNNCQNMSLPSVIMLLGDRNIECFNYKPICKAEPILCDNKNLPSFCFTISIFLNSAKFTVH